jgi:hypothetical protein
MKVLSAQGSRSHKAPIVLQILLNPAAFVTHAPNVHQEDLKKIDLLPKIRHKVLITPEWAPTFRGKDEDLTERFSLLTPVLDGQGLWIDSG